MTPGVSAEEAVVPRAEARRRGALDLFATGLVVALAPGPRGDIIAQIEDAIISFFSQIWNGIAGFFGNIFGGISATFATIFGAPAAAVRAAYTSLQDWSDQYGAFAPIITVGVIFLVFLLASVGLWLVIRISVSEAEKTGDELEEGV